MTGPTGKRAAETALSARTSANHRLNGWKEIATSLGKDERTVKRWASDRGLPVHRVPGQRRASIYAWSSEIETWLRQGATAPDRHALPAGEAEPVRAEPKHKKTLTLLGAAALAAVIAVTGFAVARLATPPAPISPAEAAASRLPQSVRAMFLDANYLWQKRTPEGLRSAEDLLLQVADLAPNFAEAQASLATVYNLMVEIAVLPAADGYRRSEAAADAAIRLDPDNAQAYTVLGDIHYYWHHDFAAGLAMFERALALAPDNAQTRQWYASALMSSGRFNEAAIEIERARALEPTSRSILVSDAMIAIGLGDVERARQILLRLVANEPDYRSPYRFLSFIALARHDRSEYLVALANRFRITGDDMGRAIVDVGMDHVDAPTDADFAQAMLTVASSDPGEVEPYFLAQLLVMAEEWDRAAQQLGKTPTRQAFYYSLDPAFSHARANSGFRQQLANLGLPVVP